MRGVRKVDKSKNPTIGAKMEGGGGPGIKVKGQRGVGQGTPRVQRRPVS